MTDTLTIDRLPLKFRAMQLMNSVLLAELKGDRIDLPDGGWADAFADEGDVDNNVVGNDANTKSLLHFDGVDGATTIVDSASVPLTVTAVGSAHIENTASKFGGTSGEVGSGSYFNLSGSALTFGSADLTIDLWVNFKVAPSGTAQYNFFASPAPTATLINFGVYQNQPSVNVSGNQFILGAALTWTAGQWYHVALVRSGNTWTFYRDGVAVGTGTAALTLTASDYRIGASADAYFDEFRLSNVARWATSFTPPTGPYAENAGGTLNAVYNPTTDLYSPTSSATTQTFGAQSATTGDFSQAGSGFTLVDFGNQLVAGDVISHVGVSQAAASANGAVKIVKRNSSGNFDVVVSESFSHPGGGFADKQLTSPFTIPATGAYFAAYHTKSSAMNFRSVATSRAYKIGDATGTAQSGFTEDTSGNISALRVLKNMMPQNMTLVSKAFTAAAEKGQALVLVQATPNEAITLNTDLLAYVCRDDTEDFAVVTLAQLMSGWYYGLADLTAKPSGTSMRVKVDTDNAKNIDVSGWAMDLSA